MSIHRSLAFNLSQRSAKRRYHINRAIDPQPAAKSDPNIYCFNTCWSFTVVRWYIEWSRTKQGVGVLSISPSRLAWCGRVCKWMLFYFILMVFIARWKVLNNVSQLAEFWPFDKSKPSNRGVDSLTFHSRGVLSECQFKIYVFCVVCNWFGSYRWSGGMKLFIFDREIILDFIVLWNLETRIPYVVLEKLLSSLLVTHIFLFKACTKK